MLSRCLHVGAVYHKFTSNVCVMRKWITIFLMQSQSTKKNRETCIFLALLPLFSLIFLNEIVDFTSHVWNRSFSSSLKNWDNMISQKVQTPDVIMFKRWNVIDWLKIHQLSFFSVHAFMYLPSLHVRGMKVESKRKKKSCAFQSNGMLGGRDGWKSEDFEISVASQTKKDK